MTWCSVDSATPRFVLASSAIRCRFVDRFVSLRVLSRVSRQRFSPHDTPLPSIGSRWVQFPDVTGRIEVLRLPITHSRSLICFASEAHAAPSIRVSQLALALPEGQRVPSGPGRCSAGDPIAGLLSRGRERDLPGSQAIRPVPLPRSRTPAEPAIPCLTTVSSMLPPLPSQRGLQRIGNFGATTRLQHLLPTLHEWCCHHPCKARFRLAG